MSVFAMNRYTVHMVPSSVATVNPVETQQRTGAITETKTENDDDPDSKAIHSGHFMLSRIHGTSLSDDEDDDEVPTAGSPPHSGFNFVDASKETCKTYKFGPKSTQTLAIDASLSKLFEKLALAYSGKLTSPKWKQFRGMHLKVVDKIRLNNVIWREWVMQYIYQREPIVCQFATPLSDDLHTKPEAIVLEGYYWKRRLATITEEYKMSRKFFKRLVERRHEDELSFLSDEHFHSELLSKVGEVTSLTNIPRQQQTSSTDLILNSRDLQDMMDLSDSLFSSLNSPFAFPNPRELLGFGYGDLIQPGLLQLQPILEDDFMELEPIPELINVRSPTTPNTATEMIFGRAPPSGQATSDSQAESFKPPEDVEMTPSPHIPQSPQMPASQQMIGSPMSVTDSASPAPPTPGSSSLFQSPQPSPSAGDTQMLMDTDNIIRNHLQMLQNQQKIENQKKLQKQIEHQKQIEQQKQRQQLKKKQQQLEQQRQQKLLEQEKQQKQLEQQKLLEQQKQQERHKKLTVLQHNLMKAHRAGNTAEAALLLDELLKVLSSGTSHSDTSANSQTASLEGSQTGALTSSIAGNSQQAGNTNSDLQTGLVNNTQQTAVQANNQQKGSLEKLGLSQPSVFQLSNFKSNQLSHVTNKPTDILAALNAGNRILSQDSTKKIVLSKQPQPKKDNAGFTVPAAPPPSNRVKQRTLAPAPSQLQASPQTASLSQQNSNSYLAQLLKTGTYPGAIIKVKSEVDKSNSTTSFQPILPADSSRSTTPSSNIKSIQSAPACISVELQPLTDFPTSVLLAAASHAFSPAVSVQEMLQSASMQVSGTTGTTSTSMITCPSQTEAPQSPTFSLGPVPTSPVSVTAGSFFDETRSQEAAESLDDSEFRKSTHISAELKRRQNIKIHPKTMKGGFDLLHTLIPSISQNPNAKISKAAMLQKTAEYCKKLKSERSQMQNERDILKQEINSLNQAISVCQSQLPATGVPFNRQRADQMKEMFEEYVKQRTLTNWKFWIFSVIIRNLFDSFNNMVSTASVDELCRTVLAWLDQYCSLVSLRPIASNAMTLLSKTTSILSDPSRVPEQAAQAVIKKPTDNNQQQT